MKNYIKIIFALLTGFLISSCDKDQDMAVLELEAKPTLTADATNFVLTKDDENKKAVRFSWTNAVYSPAVGMKNQLQFAVAGTDFESTVNTDAGEKSTSIEYTVKQLNAVALGLGLAPGQAAEVEVRLQTTISERMDPIFSEPIKLKITPYLTDYPDFFIVGEASAVGWNAGDAQKLFKDENINTIYTELKSGKAFRFLGQQDWSPLNYSIDDPQTKPENRYFKTFSSNLAVNDNENMKFTGPTGMYKIVINSDPSAKSINITPSAVAVADPANLYLVGSVNGWDAGSAIAMTKVGTGRFELNIVLPDDAEFKFIGQQSWGDLDWGDIDGAGNTGFLAPKGANNNVKFNGGGKTYKVTVDIPRGIYKINLP